MPRPASEPSRFEEAIAWFRDRIPMTDEEYAELSERARQRAFTVSGVAQLDMVEQVWDALERALEDGTTLNDFRLEVGKDLAKSWGKRDPYRLETIFRTNLQLAYAAGRQVQMRDPDVLSARPFWEFVAVLDSRTSDICRPLEHLTLPADDVFWSSNTPPLHHRCRSTLVCRTLDQGEKAGVREPPANSKPPTQGFGGDPTSDWEPDLNGKPDELVEIYQSKAS